ncbi:MAG: VIT domain-containing protein [Thermoguttaceae bacterium]
MLTYTVRIVSAGVAASVLIGAWLWNHVGSTEAADLGRAPQSAAAADTPEHTLTEDGRIGKVTDVQGMVMLRPATASRWSPVAERLLLRPGDWVRTDLRGANAATLRLVKDTRVILGPGSLVELVGPGEIRVADGELKVAAAPKHPIKLIGPDGATLLAESVHLNSVYGVRQGRLTAVHKEPLWLRGYEGKTANESIGSLVAKVDGRNVPLSVGYHKVAVDIRDQIARTSIEESFVNRTDGTLEGVFFFPLPQDASIAGFGMWIGERLVEADVVERERAREIYETILRERRDPGLLEWSGGNIFKARVFPILPHSEKRIKITYTQVLPLAGGAYRYQYALESEMLRLNPLRQLEIDVKVTSAIPLRSVTCPTHATRNAMTGHSAHVEFSAQEYTPTQDFEVVVEVEGRQREVVLIPHRRGDDGYFMVQITPPSPDGQWRRELVADGEPMELLFLADTSASMDGPSRKAQAEVIAAILASLTEKDRVNLAACDVDCQWVFARPAPADAKNVEQARQFLAARTSLGWTNLDVAIASALKQAGPKAHMLYLGDGIVTGYSPLPPGEGQGVRGQGVRAVPRAEGDSPVFAQAKAGTVPADPAAFVKRLRRLTEGKPGTFHSIAVSSSFEPGVMKAIAAAGGGSFHQVTGSRGPQAVALELLAEMTQPVLRDLRVEFRGLRVARVYPEQLPNLPLGTQQILLGRYLPGDRDQQGEVIVTGTQSGKPVRYAGKVALPEGSVVSSQLSVATNNGPRTTDDANSFIPRLWARMHLDALLEQGGSPAIRDEIIALSEEYNIITPYTSLLVLESDADRERFKVKSRFQMRDGEKFFAEGRDTANWELVQQQMKRAGAWHLGLRRDVLRQLATLGRNPQVSSGHLGTTTTTDFDSLISLINSTVAPRSWGDNSASGFISPFGANLSLVVDQSESMAFHDRRTAGPWEESGRAFDPITAMETVDADTAPVDAPAAAMAPLPALTPEEEEPVGGQAEGKKQGEVDALQQAGERLEENGDSEDLKRPQDAAAAVYKTREAFASMSAFSIEFPDVGGEDRPKNLGLSMGEISYGGGGYFERALHCYAIAKPVWETTQQSMAWLDQLFPAVPPAVAPSEQKTNWPPEARALARSLLHDDALLGFNQGVKIDRQVEGYDASTAALQSRSRTLGLASPNAWLARCEGDRSATTVAWCDEKERGTLSKAFLLGRLRKSKPADLGRLPPEIASDVPLDQTYAAWPVTMKPQGNDRTLLVLTGPGDSKPEVRILVDTARKVILRIEYFNQDAISSTTVYDNFVEVAGAWRPTRTETLDAKGRRLSLTRHAYTVLAAGEFGRLWKEELAGRDQVQFLHEPLPRLVEAKKRLAQEGDSPIFAGRKSGQSPGKAGFEDQVAMLLHFQATGQWDRVLGHLAAAERLSGKPGMRWVRGSVMNLARRRDEVKRQYFDEARNLAQSPPTASAGSAEANALTPGPSPGRAETARGRGETTGDALFLAGYLEGQTSGILEANEMLALLDLLKPVYRDQPAYLETLKDWEGRRADLLEQTGQFQEVLAYRRRLAEGHPKDAALQVRYARTLSGSGDFDAAYAWLDRAVRSNAGLEKGDSPHLPERPGGCFAQMGTVPFFLPLRTTCADMLRSEGRYAELVDYLADWIKQNPPVQDAYSQYLSALVWADRAKEADATIAAWLNLSQSPPTASGGSPDEQRLRAAVAQAMGQGYNLWSNRMDEKWQRPLADTALALARHPTLASIADQIMGQWQFQQSDECRRVRRAALRALRDEIEKLPPEQIQRFVNWISSNDPAVELPEWKKIAEGLRRRWDAEPRREVRSQLGGTLIGVLGHLGPQETLAFLRKQLEEASPDDRPGYARQLFDALLGQRWSGVSENEAFGLLERLSGGQTPVDRLREQVSALMRLDDAMVQARFQAAMAKVEHPEKLTRTELRAKQAENMKLAREGFADRLRQASANAPEKLIPWMTVERLYLDIHAGRRLDRVADECFELLGPPTPPAAAEDPMAAVDSLLRHRALVMLINMAARSNSPLPPGEGPGVRATKPPDAVGGLCDRVIDYLEKRVKAEPENPGWKLMEYQVLIALDRPNDLRKKLQEWIDAGDPANYWSLALGYLLAEEGRLREAVKLLEAVRDADELRGPDYRALAAWYQVLDRREDHDRAIIDALKVAGEYQLSNWISRKLGPWQRDWSTTKQPPPRELDREVPLAFVALLEKSTTPEDYTHQLRAFYQATRDFRLLGALADGMIGHTPGQVYPLLQNLGSLLGDIHDEATADTLVERLGEVRKRATTPIDRRALDLLEMLVERRAAELQNQPGPHAQRALGSLARAWKHEWSAGEPRLMAELLASLGAIAQKDLAAEQVRRLEEIGEKSEKGEKDEKGETSDIDRLHIRYCLARTYWAYGRQEEAIDRLTAALGQYQAVCGGRLGAAVNDILGTLISCLESRGQYVRAENYLKDQLQHPANQQQRWWLSDRLWQVCHNALTAGGEVSLGRGEPLYRAIEAGLRKDLGAPDQNYRTQLVGRLCGVYRTATQQKLPGVANDLRKFAFERLPQVLLRQTNGYDEMVSNTAQTLHDLAGPKDGLALLVWHAEHEPAWFQNNYQDVWSRHGSTMGQWRFETPNLGDLEPRLLAVVLGELRRDLRSRQHRYEPIYDQRYSSNHYWREKEADFARTAEEVLATGKDSSGKRGQSPFVRSTLRAVPANGDCPLFPATDSSAAVTYITEYIFFGVNRQDRAIAVLLDAHRREVLDEGGQSQLVRFLHARGRFAQSIAILEPLVSRRPDNLDYRVWLVHAYHQTGQPKRLAELLRQTDEYFHKDGRWQENVMARLGESCLENALFKTSVGYFREAVSHRQRTAPRRGIGDGTLSNYYGQMARAYAGLKKTADAVDAACGAIVSWGQDMRNRTGAIASLRAVLQQAPDLDAYVLDLDRQTAQNGLENPVVRKAVGQVCQERQQYAKAIAQLRLALEAQPNDAETHQALLACYDAAGDKQSAIEALLHMRELDRRNINLYRDLGGRLEKLGQPDQTERAYTSIVEVLPQEAESHQLLAEIRQQENRWPEAIAEWDEVARIRSLEPTGLLGLAAAQMHTGRWDDAEATFGKLRGTGWPARFDAVISQKLPELQRQLEGFRKADRKPR